MSRDYTTVGYYLHDDSIVCSECCTGGEKWESGYGYRKYYGAEPTEGGVLLHKARTALKEGKPLRCKVCGGSMIWQDIEYTGAGDYSNGGGDLVCRSNYRSISAELRDRQKKWEEGDEEPRIEENAHWRQTSGSHGYLALEAQVMADTQDIHPAIKEIEKALENYPLFDEEDHTELEREIENEAWDSGMRRDLIKAMAKRLRYDNEEDTDPRHETVGEQDARAVQLYDMAEFILDEVGTISKKLAAVIDERFHSLAEEANEYWEHSLSATYIDLTAIAKKVSKFSVEEFCQAVYDVLKEDEGA